MEQPKGFETFSRAKDTYVYLLKRTLYGFKQALRAWYTTTLALIATLKDWATLRVRQMPTYTTS